jgi:hypothetical protein
MIYAQVNETPADPSTHSSRKLAMTFRNFSDTCSATDPNSGLSTTVIATMGSIADTTEPSPSS